MCSTMLWSSSVFSLTVLILPVIFLLWYQRYSWRFRNLHRIPGPSGYPIIGQLRTIMLDQEATFANDRKRAVDYYPIYKLWSFHIAVVAVLLPEDVEIILSNVKYIQKSDMYKLLEPWLGTGLLTGNGLKWHARRKILTPAFHFNILQDFLTVFNEETANLVETLEKHIQEPYINVVPLITHFTLDAILQTSMGTNLNRETEKYENAVHEFGKLAIYRMSRPWLYGSIAFRLTSKGKMLSKTLKLLHDFTNSVIEEKKKKFNLNEDAITSYSGRKRLAMLDLLLAARINNSADLNDEGIREEVDTFMFEGHDTTSTAICFVLLTLANHPKVQDEIYKEIIEVMGKTTDTPTYNTLQELTYMERCLKECLRLYPSVPFIARRIPEDITSTTGYIIPKGTNVHVYIYDIHRNPEIYPDPEKFDPDRFLPENVKERHPFAYIPFSAGPRNCIGQRFAMLELKTVLCGILRRFRLEAIDKPTDVVFLADLVLRPKNGIKVKLAARRGY